MATSFNKSKRPNIKVSFDLYNVKLKFCNLNIIEKKNTLSYMSCEGACAHANVRCAVARVRVRAKSILESVGDVRACGPF